MEDEALQPRVIMLTQVPLQNSAIDIVAVWLIGCMKILVFADQAQR